MPDFWSQQVTVGWVVALVVVLVVVVLFYHLRLATMVSSQMTVWEKMRLDAERTNIDRTLRTEYDLRLKEWKSAYAGYIRQDAISRSKSVIAGRVAENIAPFLPTFPFNPKDARFLGNPVDFIVFDGLDAGDLREIVFLEMKTQGSRVTARQKSIRTAIHENRVSWEEIRWAGNAIDEALPDVLYDDIG